MIVRLAFVCGVLSLALACTDGEEVCHTPISESEGGALVNQDGSTVGRRIGLPPTPNSETPCQDVASGLPVLDELRVCPLFAVSENDPGDPTQGEPLFACPEGVTEPDAGIPQGLRNYCLIEYQDSPFGFPRNWEKTALSEIFR